MNDNEINILVKAKDEASKVLGDAEQKARGFGSAMSDVGKIAGGFILANGIMEAPGFLLEAAQAAADDAANVSKLRQAVENTGASWDQYSSSIDQVIKDGQRKAFTDDQVRNSLALLTAQTGSADEAQKRFALAMDLSRGAGIDLETASKLLGKVTEDNVNVLGRYGITVKEGASETELFGAIQAKFGGQAETFAKSTAGQMESAKIGMSELKEQIGYQLMPVMAKLGEVLVTDVIPGIQRFFDMAQPKFQEFGQFVQEEFAKFQVYYEEHLKPALDNVQKAFEALSPVIIPILQEIANQVQLAFDVITGILNIFILLLSGNFAGAWEAARDLVADVWEHMKQSVQNGVDFITGALGILKDSGIALIRGLLEGAQNVAGEIYQWFRELPGNIMDAVGDLSMTLWSAGRQLIMGMVNGVKNAVGDLISAVTGAIGGAISAATGALGIHSPSTVFRDIGLQTMAGLEQGVQGGSRGVSSAVTTASHQMVASGAEGAYSGREYSRWTPVINIYIDGKKLADKDAARLVISELHRSAQLYGAV